MNDIIQAASNFAAQNLNYILSGIGLFVVSAIMAMPEHPTPGFRWIGQDNWTWARDTLQTMVPVKRPITHNPNPFPAQPETERTVNNGA